MTEFSVSPEMSKAQLLVVDDEVNVRVTLSMFLQRRGYHVGEASSGLEALAQLHGTAYDLMVLDMMMPGMTGMEVMRCAREICPDLAIIVLTAHATVESAIAAVKANVTDYMLKPCNLEDLAVTVARTLQERLRQTQRQRLLSMVGEVMDSLRQTDVPLPPALQPVPAVAPPAAPIVNVLRVGPLTLDRDKRLATLGHNPSQAVELTEGETAILEALMQHPNQVFSCNQLADVTAGCDGLDKWTVENIVRSSVFRLRQKIESAPDKPSLIRTVRGRGYFFAAA